VVLFLMGAWEANERYEGLRDAAREFVFEIFTSEILIGELASLAVDLRFTDINDKAIGAWLRTRQAWEFDWFKVAHHFWTNDPDRFEIAIWKGEELCGMAIGRPSNGPDNVTLHFIERRGDHAALKGWIAQMVTDGAEAYAKLLGKQRVKLKDPSAGAIPLYVRLGFSLAEPIGQTTYYARSVDNESPSAESA
jgi:hypothetical protein